MVVGVCTKLALHYHTGYPVASRQLALCQRQMVTLIQQGKKEGAYTSIVHVTAFIYDRFQYFLALLQSFLAAFPSALGIHVLVSQFCC